MNTRPNTQLQFFIKLTEIIGRAFTDLQQLLTSQLKRQQSDAQDQSVAMKPQPNQKPMNHISEDLVNLSSHSQGLAQDDKKQSQEQGEINKKEIPERNVKKSTRINKHRKLRKIKLAVQEKKKRKRRTNKMLQEQGKPSPPLNAFMLFLKDNKYDIMGKKPELSPSEVSIYASTIWNGFDESEKQRYLSVYKKNHDVYLQEMRKYKEKVKKNKNSQEKKYPDKKGEQVQNSFKSDLRSKLRTRIKKRKFIRNQVICIESQDEKQLNSYHN